MSCKHEWEAGEVSGKAVCKGCGDEVEWLWLLVELGEAVAERDEKMKKLEEVLVPIDAHFQGKYNQWRKEHRREPGLMEAAKELHRYLRRKRS